MNISAASIHKAMGQLESSGLWRENPYANGIWVLGDASCTEVLNPATGERLGQVTGLSLDQLRDTVDSAHSAFHTFRKWLPQQRAELLQAWRDLIVSHREELALIMTLEQGKGLSDARGEVDYGCDFIGWFAEEAKRMNGQTIASHLAGKHLMSQPEPLGVAALVTPWNFPLAMLTRKAAAALAAGCSVVAYPSPETPFTALALARLAELAGFPAGIFNVICGDAVSLVGELCTNTKVRAFSFTGSTEIGRILNAQCAATVKKVSMELGGHAPFIGFADVGVENLVEGVLAAKFATSGQDCLAANRIYIQRAVYPEFLERFGAAVSDLKIGSGLEAGVQIGPLQNAKQLAKAEAHVKDALQKGARLLVGGGRHERGGLFFEPTVLADVTSDMLIYREETFGPVAGILPFDDEDSVLKAASDTEYGLAAYVFTRDIERAWKFADTLEYGMVAVNSVKITGAPVPFGGVKQSGLGREGAAQGMEAFTETKYICMGTLAC